MSSSRTSIKWGLTLLKEGDVIYLWMVYSSIIFSIILLSMVTTETVLLNQIQELYWLQDTYITSEVKHWHKVFRTYFFLHAELKLLKTPLEGVHFGRLMLAGQRGRPNLGQKGQNWAQN